MANPSPVSNPMSLPTIPKSSPPSKKRSLPQNSKLLRRRSILLREGQLNQIRYFAQLFRLADCSNVSYELCIGPAQPSQIPASQALRCVATQPRLRSLFRSLSKERNVSPVFSSLSALFAQNRRGVHPEASS